MVPAHLSTFPNSYFPFPIFQKGLPAARLPAGQGRQGFTLVELMIVAALIGVLSSAVIIAINVPTQFAKVRDSQRKNDLRSIQNALELSYSDNRAYPQALPAGGSSFIPYIQLVPKDPKSGWNYVYQQALGGQGYRLYAALERCQSPSSCFDRQACNSGSPCQNAGNANCGGVCTYGVASSNLSP